MAETGNAEPQVPTRNEQLDEYQLRLFAWQKANFDECRPEQMVLGILEELWELKVARGGYEDPNSKRATMEQLAAINDAKADILIFATQLASIYDIRLSKIWTKGYYTADVLPILGRLAQTVLKSSQNIRNVSEGAKTTIASLLAELFRWVGTTEPNFFETAEKVMTRRWKENPSGEGY